MSKTTGSGGTFNVPKSIFTDDFLELFQAQQAAMHQAMLDDSRAMNLSFKRQLGEELTDDEQRWWDERLRKQAEWRAARERREAEERANALTVAQLIEHLSTLDPDLPVRVVAGYHDWDEPWAGTENVSVETDDKGGYVMVGG